MMEDRCICCGEIIPEGMMACPNCLVASKKMQKEKGCEYCKGRAYTKKPLTVTTIYGKTIKLAFEYCPNCGRKLREEDGKHRSN